MSPQKTPVSPSAAPSGRTAHRPERVGRRDFLAAAALGAAGAWAAGPAGFASRLALAAGELRRRGLACVVLWMQGGPSQLETFDPKPDHRNGGGTKAISTATSGVHVASHLPQIASVMNDICLLRGVNSREGSHQRGSYLLHTSYLPTASIKYPTLGSHVAKALGDPAFDLPNFVRVGRALGAGGAGFLGIEHEPFVVMEPGAPPENTTILTDEARYRRRLQLLGRLETHYAESGGQQEVADHRQVLRQSARMILSPKMSVFQLDNEPAASRQAYGDSDFGKGCLLARRLVEAGAPCVEVTLGNWDTHVDNFTRTPELCQQLDQPFAQLLRDFKRTGQLDTTLVVCLGEFGRTPRVNPRGGRDHYPKAFSVALAGCGVRGGQVIGATDAGGETVSQRPVGVQDLFQTIYSALKIDANAELMSPIGRPIKLVDGGDVVKEVFTG